MRAINEQIESEVVEHLAKVRHLLRTLFARASREDDRRDLERALADLETALSLLTTDTGGIL